MASKLDEARRLMHEEVVALAVARLERVLTAREVAAIGAIQCGSARPRKERSMDEEDVYYAGDRPRAPDLARRS
jgi:hypothetical protein